SGSVLSQVANWAAAARCGDLAATATEEPPQKPVWFSPAFHCGIGAMAHLPSALGALLSSVPGAQTADGQVSSLPSLRALFHSGVKYGVSSMTPSLTRPPQ